MNPLAPSSSLLCKIGSALVHVEEARGKKGHAFDWGAFDAILSDPEVKAWLADMDRLALLPKKR